MKNEYLTLEEITALADGEDIETLKVQMDKGEISTVTFNIGGITMKLQTNGDEDRWYGLCCENYWNDKEAVLLLALGRDAREDEKFVPMFDTPTSKSLYNSNQCNGRAFEYMKKLEQQLAAAREKLELSEERYIANRDLLNGIENWCEVVFMPPSGAIITINDWDDLKNHIAAMEESK